MLITGILIDDEAKLASQIFDVIKFWNILLLWTKVKHIIKANKTKLLETITTNFKILRKLMFFVIKANDQWSWKKKVWLLLLIFFLVGGGGGGERLGLGTYFLSTLCAVLTQINLILVFVHFSSIWFACNMHLFSNGKLKLSA